MTTGGAALRGGLLGARSAARSALGGRGIGVFFNTRKGQFQYEISSYIIIYHVAIIIYHCVSSPVS